MRQPNTHTPLLASSANQRNNNNASSNSSRSQEKDGRPQHVRSYSDPILLEASLVRDLSQQRQHQSLRITGTTRGGITRGDAHELCNLHFASSKHVRPSVSNDKDLLEQSMSLHGSTYMLAQYIREQPTPQEPSNGSTLVHDPRSRLSTSRLSKSQRFSAAIHQSVRQSAPNWWKDFVTSFTPGSISQSVVIAFFIAVVNGVACFAYYEAMDFGLEFVWKTVPVEWLQLNPETSWWWIPAAGFTCSILLGLAVVLLGEPGDMPFTVASVHQKGFIPMNHVVPMVVASYFSILAGASLGPEAPLVAICGALGGWVSRTLFHQELRKVVRKHTLMGMAGALAAFFGAPLGGSFFALEICNRFGVEYFEDLMPSIWCGELTLLIFRALVQVKIGPIWEMPKEVDASISDFEALKIDLWTIPAGAVLGLIGAGMAYLFAVFHTHFIKIFSMLGLLDNSRAVWRAIFGGVFVYAIGTCIPHTMFWAEDEMQVVLTRAPASELPHVWPTSGLLGFEVDTPWKTALVGLLKLMAISFSLAQGSRGGFIFPFFFAGASVGRAISDWIPGLSVPVASLCVAASTNTAITRTSLATTLILVFLSGETTAWPAILMASLVSLFATGQIRFIKTQMARSDIDHSMYHYFQHKKRSSSSIDEESVNDDQDIIDEN